MTEIERHAVRRRRHRRRRRRAARGHRGPRARACAPRSSASRCSARPTPSWPRAASPRRWATSTATTTGRCTSATPCAAASSSTTGGWPSCTPRRRRTGSGSWRPTARCSTARPDGKISQRNFGGHEYPRLAHVGDRTGLELIRTLQQKIVSLQQEDFARDRRLRGAAEGLRRVHGHPAAQGRTTGAIAGAFGYWRESGPVRRVRGARGRPGHRRHRQVLQGHQQLLGVHRRRARAGAARRRHR